MSPEEAVRVSRRRAVVAGLLTGTAGLVVAQFVSSALRLRLSPPYAVAEAVIEATPGRLAVKLVHLVGRWDKPLLVTGVFIGLVVLSAVAGLLARRRVLYGQLLFLAMAFLAAAAALSRPGAGASALLPVLVGALVWVFVLPVLVRTPTPATTPEASRREFLGRAAVVGGATVVFAVAGKYVGRARRAVEAARAKLKLPVTGGTVPAGAQVEGLGPWQVPNGDFYRIDTATIVPTVDVDTWKLRIHGMVENEVTVNFQDLLDRQLTEAWVTLCCVSNTVGGDLIGNAWWSGVRIAELLAEAKPLSGADAVRQTSADGWDCGTPLSVLTDDRNAMLAIAMNGRPLPLEHGFPVRMVVPGLYGFVSATKWVVDLEVTRFEDFEAFWTVRGWSPQGPVKTQSRIEVPKADHRVMAGEVRVGGTAWAQHTGIDRVEVRLDGGPWTEVELGRVPSDNSWVQWAGTIAVDPGVHELAVRATDKSGYTQTGVRRDVIPDGATGWHTVGFTAE